MWQDAFQCSIPKVWRQNFRIQSNVPKFWSATKRCLFSEARTKKKKWKNNILGKYEKSWLIQCFARKCLNMICFFNFLFQHCVDGTPGFTRKCQNLGVPMRNIVWIRCKPNRDTSIFWDPWLIYFSPRKCLNMKRSMTSLFWGDSLDHVFFEVGF